MSIKHLVLFIRKQGTTHGMIGYMSQGHRSQLAGTLTDQNGDDMSIKIMILTDYNPSYKIGSQ